MWIEKYRPKRFEEIVGQEKIKEALLRLAKGKKRVHLLFVGPAGCGKTSMAICYAREIFGENWKNYFVELNASDERGIETIRQKIKRLAQTKGERIVLLDESDQMTSDAQHALRRILEKTQGTTFIFSANEEHKIIDPIKSRCAVFHFKKLGDKEVLLKLLEICKEEGLEIDEGAKKSIYEIVKLSKGDLRLAINALESSTDGKKIVAEKVYDQLLKTKLIDDALTLTLKGDFERGKRLLEEALIENRFNYDDVINEFFEAIGKLPNEDMELKTRLFERLSQTEAYCKLGTNPLIQLVGFLSWVWIAPHLRRIDKNEDSKIKCE